MSARLALDARRAREFFRVDVRLVSIIADILLPSWPTALAVVSSIYRTPEEDAAVGGSGVHCTRPHRAVDIAADRWDDPLVWEVAHAINREWQYDPARPHKQCALYRRHGTGPHVHLQVHPRTQRRMRHA